MQNTICSSSTESVSKKKVGDKITDKDITAVCKDFKSKVSEIFKKKDNKVIDTVLSSLRPMDKKQKEDWSFTGYGSAVSSYIHTQYVDTYNIKGLDKLLGLSTAELEIAVRNNYRFKKDQVIFSKKYDSMIVSGKSIIKYD